MTIIKTLALAAGMALYYLRPRMAKGFFGKVIGFSQIAPGHQGRGGKAGH